MTNASAIPLVDPAVAREEAQLLVASSVSRLRASTYWLLQVSDPDPAKRWLAQVIESGLVHAAQSVSDARAARAKDAAAAAPGHARAPREPEIDETVAVAFSHAGLRALDVKTLDETFPRAFTQGMGSASRGRLLGDWDGLTGDQSSFDRRDWVWSDASAPDHPASNAAVQAHLFVAHFHHPGRDTRLTPPSPAHGFVVIEGVSQVRGCPSYIQDDAKGRRSYEPFGFRDGIGQPNVPGLTQAAATSMPTSTSTATPQSPPPATHAAAMESCRAAREARADRHRHLSPRDGDNTAALGEFVLGQINGYGEPSPCPDVAGWPQGRDRTPRFGHHASYLVVRQIEQMVEAFRRFHVVIDKDKPSLAERMIGRRIGDPGLPLTRPYVDPASLPHEARSTTNGHGQGYGYGSAKPTTSTSKATAAALATRPGLAASTPAATTATIGEPTVRFRLDDPVGFDCPRGAHIRRANPRDSLGVDITTGLQSNNLHRLLRRGRTYTTQRRCEGNEGTCGDDAHRVGVHGQGSSSPDVEGDRAQAAAIAPSDNPLESHTLIASPDATSTGCGRGLMFVACNADLERQFEFVHQQWIMNPRFPDLGNEDDPILGRRRRFTVQAAPCGHTVSGLPEFTKTVGGGYFLLPGLTALGFIAGLGVR